LLFEHEQCFCEFQETKSFEQQNWQCFCDS